ncbi:MAG: hypothetical protein ILA34_03945 [Bacteroidaceae bacterium]|nr:hypothetical protein [Bacteroidaceae bacterium]
MKKTLLWGAALLACLHFSDLSAAAKKKLAGVPVSAYTIVYSAQAEEEEGIAMAKCIQKKLEQATGEQVQIASDSAFRKGHAIAITHGKGTPLWDYSIRAAKGRVTLDGGGCWAMDKAADILAAQLAQNSIPAGYSTKGTVEGEVLFARPEGANLRILDDNIWDYSKETWPEKWKELGVDPRDDVRAPKFAQLVRAYMPDVVTIQEYNKHMHDRFYPLIQKYGYDISYESGADWNNTPIFYKKDALELISVNYNLYTPKQWCNAGSKSFQSAVFKHKATGKVFAVLNTHLWWMGEWRQPGSTQARASQVRLMIAEAEILKAKHDCTMFVTGDMNCYENTTPIRQFLDEGFVPCYKAATLYGDNHNGHHICSAGDGFSRNSRRPSPYRAEGALDHCFIYNFQKHNTEVKVFDCIQAYFTIELTDHYPNLIDARL